MLKLLLKKQLYEIFQSFFYDAKKNKARSGLSAALCIGLFVLLVFVLLGGIFTWLSVKLCAPLVSANLGWLYFALTGLIAVLLGAFGSVFNTYAGLYLPKDNDLLLSMPIPVHTLVASRLFEVYLMGLMYSAIVIIPAVTVYWATAGITFPTVFGGLVLILLISVFVLTLSCLLGRVVAEITQKLKHKSLLTVAASLVFIGLYYFVYFKAQSIIRDLLVNATAYGEQIKGKAYPLYLFGSVGVGNAKAVIIVFASVAALFALMWLLLSHSFLRIATSAEKSVHKEYKETSNRQRSVDAALLRREFARFTASPGYMLNCGLGTFIMPLCAIAALWKGGELFAALDSAFGKSSEIVPLLLCIMLCGLSSMNFMTSPSVSLEGKSLWLMQSLPVETVKIFRAKVRLQLILTAPPLFLCIVCALAVYPLQPTRLLSVIFFAGSYVLLGALSGLTLGVRMPTLTWTNELMPIKQSAPVIITMFGGMGYTVLLFAGFLFLPEQTLSFPLYIGCFTAANLILCACNCLWLQKNGVARFRLLGSENCKPHKDCK